MNKIPIFKTEEVGEVLQEFYHHEINITLSWSWDAGIDISRGAKTTSYYDPTLGPKLSTYKELDEQGFFDMKNHGLVNIAVSALAYTVYMDGGDELFNGWYEERTGFKSHRASNDTEDEGYQWSDFGPGTYKNAAWD